MIVPDTNEIYGENADTQFPMASLVKLVIMVGVLGESSKQGTALERR